MRLVTDTFAYCAEHLPLWNTISVSGYHIREAGSSAAQEIAFTLANGVAYVEAAMAVGLNPDAFMPRMSFFFASHNNLFEEAAKFRAARRMWASIARDRFGATDPKSQTLRFHTQTGGVTLTAQQPLNNVVRVAYQALAAVLGGTQSLHTNGYDEALALPTAEAATIALRTQQILAFETGVADTADPLAGSYFVEALTDELEAAATVWMDRIAEQGGAVASIEAGAMQAAIADNAYRLELAREQGDQTIVGVNRFADEAAAKVPLQRIDQEAVDRQVSRVEGLQVGSGPGSRRRRPGRCRNRRPGRCQPAAGDERRPHGRRHHRAGSRAAPVRLRRVPPGLRVSTPAQFEGLRQVARTYPGRTRRTGGSVGPGDLDHDRP